MEFVGKTVKKEVKGVGTVSGTVKSYDPTSGFVEILHEDGHSEELESSDVASLLESPSPELATARPRVGRKPKKRRRVERKHETTTSSGNVVSDNNNLVAEGSELRGTNNNDNDDNNNGSIGGNLDVGNGENGGNLNVNVNGSVNGNGSVGTVGKGIEVEEGDLNEGVSANGNCVKDGLDLNARVNLNEDMDMDMDINLNNDACGSPFDAEGGGLERRDCIDLNLDVNNEEDVNLSAGGCSGGETLRRECKFDLNVEVCEEVRDAHGDGHAEVDALVGKMGELQEEETNVNHRSMEDGGVLGNLNHVSDAVKLEEISAQHKMEGDDGKEGAAMDCPSEAGFAIVHECQDDPGSPCNQGSSRRKRRKVSDNLETTMDTVLRRSSRRASARKKNSSAVSVQVTDGPLPSLGTSVTEEKPLMPDTEKYEQCNVPLPKLQLPPSSQNLNLDDVPVLELFSVYACLRSFSTLLFLSPFELEDLVAALKSEVPSILFDSIHVSMLQTLRKHLEYLSNNEGSQSASICLRYVLFQSFIDHASNLFSIFIFLLQCYAGILAGISWTWSHGPCSWPSTFGFIVRDLKLVLILTIQCSELTTTNIL